MQHEPKADIQKLEKTITALSDALSQLGNTQDMRELLLIIKRPGWTSVAESLFAQGIADSMLTAVQTVSQLKNALLKGSNTVGR